MRSASIVCYRLKVEMCTYLQPISNNQLHWKRGGSESRQKMNIQQEVGHVKKKGKIRNVNWDLTRKTWISFKSTTVYGLFWHGPPPVGYSSFCWLSDPPLFDMAVGYLSFVDFLTHPFLTWPTSCWIFIFCWLSDSPLFQCSCCL